LIAYLDSHVAVYIAQGMHKRMSREAHKLIDRAELLISPIVLVEMETLHEIGRFRASSQDILRKLEYETGLRVCDLPFAKVAEVALGEGWTRDPFDRMIVAQAKARGLATLSPPMNTLQRTTRAQSGRPLRNLHATHHVTTLMRFLTPALLCALTAHAQQPTADAIMAKVAANQDQSEAERPHYLYVQHAHVTSRAGKTIHCEETTDTRIAPTETGYTHHLLKLDGHVLIKRKYVTYTQLPGTKNPDAEPTGDQSITLIGDDDDPMDRDLVEHMRDDLTRNKSKDGIGAGLFPLTSKTQADYTFQLLGTEHINGREVFHIVFSPRDKKDYAWKGDAYIDTTAYQPVLVRTKMSRQIPFAVRTLLGTSLPNLGFTVIYAPEPADKPGAIWFPISFGTEFKLHILFFLNREITLNVENRNFEKTHVTSKIVPVAAPAP
jgi:PIN domain nuclease of toxin-antitoxin system